MKFPLLLDLLSAPTSKSKRTDSDKVMISAHGMTPDQTQISELTYYPILEKLD